MSSVEAEQILAKKGDKIFAEHKALAASDRVEFQPERRLGDWTGDAVCLQAGGGLKFPHSPPRGWAIAAIHDQVGVCAKIVECFLKLLDVVIPVAYFPGLHRLADIL